MNVYEKHVFLMLLKVLFNTVFLQNNHQRKPMFGVDRLYQHTLTYPTYQTGKAEVMTANYFSVWTINTKSKTTCEKCW